METKLGFMILQNKSFPGLLANEQDKWACSTLSAFHYLASLYSYRDRILEIQDSISRKTVQFNLSVIASSPPSIISRLEKSLV